MAQPTRKKKKKINGYFPQGTGKGLEYCNECPFLDYKDGKTYCNIHDMYLLAIDGKIPVPAKCGNNKNTNGKSL